MANKRKRKFPKLPPGAELIIKSNCECTSRFSGWIVPGMFLLGNRLGLEWLSEYLAWFAGLISEDAPFNKNDPDNHEHLDDKVVVNQRLSDDMGFMIGGFAQKHRRKTLPSCGVTRSKRIMGSPVKQLTQHLGFIETCCDLEEEAGPQIAKDLAELIDTARDMQKRLEAKLHKGG